MEQARRAKAAARRLATLGADVKNAALEAMAAALTECGAAILEANAADLEAGRERGLSEALLDRLMLNEKRLRAMAEGLQQVAALPDPIGQVIAGGRRPNGLEIQRVRVPLGVVGVIYESRPNVTADAAGLCLKSGNAVILRGGSDSFHSTRAIHACLVAGLREAGLPEAAIARAPFASRVAVGAMLEGLD